MPTVNSMDLPITMEKASHGFVLANVKTASMTTLLGRPDKGVNPRYSTAAIMKIAAAIISMPNSALYELADAWSAKALVCTAWIFAAMTTGCSFGSDFKS